MPDSLHGVALHLGLNTPSLRLGESNARVVRLMENHLDFPLSLQELADAAGIPSRTLSYVCKRVFGESPENGGAKVCHGSGGIVLLRAA